MLVAFSVANGNSGGGDSIAAWSAHRAEISKLPDAAYHEDRFRAIRGRVTDEGGKPVAGALVRCAKVESLVELARDWTAALPGWTVPIETYVTTGKDGTYEFRHLPVGARTFFYSAPGRDLAPAIKDLIVVQDGVGARVDVKLGKPVTLVVRFASPVAVSTQLYLIPHRWWPSLETATVPARWRATEFRGVGGPFRKGLIATSGPSGSAPLRVIARYDLDVSAEVGLRGSELRLTRLDLPEAVAFDPWRFEPSTEERLFFAVLSPVALFWRNAPLGWPSWLAMPPFLARATALLKPARPGNGVARGFAPHAFLPVLIESRTAGPRLVWTNEASEFEVHDLAAGNCRARASTPSAESRSRRASRSDPARQMGRTSTSGFGARSISTNPTAVRSWDSCSGRAGCRWPRRLSSCRTHTTSASTCGGSRPTNKGSSGSTTFQATSHTSSLPCPRTTPMRCGTSSILASGFSSAKSGAS